MLYNLVLVSLRSLNREAKRFIKSVNWPKSDYKYNLFNNFKYSF